MKNRQSQNGFTLVLAMFILVVLALLGGYMLSISGSQQAIPGFALQGSRVFQAARAGSEWGIYRVITDDPLLPNGCDNIDANPTFTLTDPGLTGIRVNITCTRRQETESGNTINIYFIESIASFGAANTQDFVRREINVSVTPP
jgi:MSHA biogenesis protein MshP